MHLKLMLFNFHLLLILCLLEALQYFLQLQFQGSNYKFVFLVLDLLRLRWIFSSYT